MPAPRTKIYKAPSGLRGAFFSRIMKSISCLCQAASSGLMVALRVGGPTRTTHGNPTRFAIIEIERAIRTVLFMLTPPRRGQQ
jgi:hypothetical protein